VKLAATRWWSIGLLAAALCLGWGGNGVLAIGQEDSTPKAKAEAKNEEKLADEKPNEPPAPEETSKEEVTVTTRATDVATESTEGKPINVAPAEAAPPPPTYDLNETQYALDNFILFVCAVLVIFMQAGFALVETGLNAAKNAVNIMFKNFMDFCIGALLFYVVGYNLMYPDHTKDLVPKWLGAPAYGVAMDPVDADPERATVSAKATMGGFHKSVDFLFQVAFCATAATIVSGAVAGRIKFSAYIGYTVFISAIVYPISGMWMWGMGWLFDMGFKDFAGSVVVHTVGGMAGLAGALALGPRLGRYVKGKPIPMPGHNLPFVALGVFILMIGWYGFNPGSQLAFIGKANTATTMNVAVTTTLAGCAGGIMGMVLSWVLFKKPDLTLALNGTLAGLVGITANCHCVTNDESVIIGAIAGVIVIGAVLLLDKLQIDDPVGAFPVHGCCGIWGGIATGIFGDPKLAGFSAEPLTLSTQIIGTVVIAAWAFFASAALFYGLKALGMLRVSEEEEIKGLDICEHGMYAYPAAQVTESYTGTMGASD
jgi:Amt family ammonium transporter